MFTDIVGSTRLAAEFGDMLWRELLAAHHERARREVERFRGREVDSAGDGMLATFDGPGPCRALRVHDAMHELELRAGITPASASCQERRWRGPPFIPGLGSPP